MVLSDCVYDIDHMYELRIQNNNNLTIIIIY